MEITEVRVFMKDVADKKLKAFATITFDNCFVVRNVKIIEGSSGLFVAMPSRRVKESCPKCNYKNVIRSKFCNNCGAPLSTLHVAPVSTDITERRSEHKDIAHPITLQCREYIQKKVLEAFDKEKTSGVRPSAGEEEEHEEI